MTTGGRCTWAIRSEGGDLVASGLVSGRCNFAEYRVQRASPRRLDDRSASAGKRETCEEMSYVEP